MPVKRMQKRAIHRLHPGQRSWKAETQSPGSASGRTGDGAEPPLPHQIAATATAARVRQATRSGCLAISIFITPIVRLRKRSRVRRDARMPPDRNAEPPTKIGKKVETRRPESVFLRLRRRRTLRPAGSPGRRPPRYVPAALRHRTVRAHGTAAEHIVSRPNA